MKKIFEDPKQSAIKNNTLSTNTRIVLVLFPVQKLHVIELPAATDTNTGEHATSGENHALKRLFMRRHEELCHLLHWLSADAASRELEAGF